jgi:phage gpG-like protein
MDVTFHPSPFILAAQFEKFGLNIRSYREPLQQSIKEVVAPSLQKNFDVGGRPSWLPLANLTVALKEYRGAAQPATPLVFTGKLRRIAGQQNLWSINGLAGEASLSGAKLGEVWYGIVQQQGADTGRGVIPPRPWAVLQEEDADKIEDIFWRWITMRAMAAGLIGGVFL